MRCFHPLQGYMSRSLPRRVVFDLRKGYADKPMAVPCGYCHGCLQRRAANWAIRISHEASLHDDNCFMTLTYKNEKLPKYGSLDRRAFPLFMRRLRKRFPYGVGDESAPKKIRYFHCGEYGEKYGRPHYHAILFGFDFRDKEVVSSRNGFTVWESKVLSELWPSGFHELGSVTLASAQYVAQYLLKRAENGVTPVDDLRRVVPDSGELVRLAPEFATMSRRPGIGKGWFEKYKDDVYPHDRVVLSGSKLKPPRYYDQQLSELELEAVKVSRRENVDLREGLPHRLAAQEAVAVAASKLYAREEL